jgi:hypothetical protein
MNNTHFVKGLDLNRDFYFKAIEPILIKEFPDLQYAAALIGVGSEVLGFDSQMSSDHHWGPRGMLFLSADVHEKHHQIIWDVLANGLPYIFGGYATHFTPPDEKTGKSWTREEINRGPINHLVGVLSLETYCERYLGINPGVPMTPKMWLTIPGQRLRTFTGGEVFRDGIGELTELRKRLAYYPDQVWLYLLTAAWARIGQEEHLMGRAGFQDDDLGSRLIGARLVHDLMNLCFLIERVYPPYSKWFGTAFKELGCADQLIPIFTDTLSASDWKERQEAIIPAYEFVAESFNQLGLVEPIPERTSQFFGRPFQVIWGDHVVIKLIEKIEDPAVKKIATTTLIGSVEQFSTSTDLLSDISRCVKARDLYS